MDYKVNHVKCNTFCLTSWNPHWSRLWKWRVIWYLNVSWRV